LRVVVVVEGMLEVVAVLEVSAQEPD